MTARPAFNRSRAKPGIYYLGRTRTEDGQHSVTLGVSGKHYTYTLTPIQCDTVEYLCKRISALRALNYAKSRASLIVATSMS